MRRQTKGWLAAHGVRPRRRLGQSFLVAVPLIFQQPYTPDNLFKLGALSGCLPVR